MQWNNGLFNLSSLLWLDFHIDRPDHEAAPTRAPRFGRNRCRSLHSYVVIFIDALVSELATVKTVQFQKIESSLYAHVALPFIKAV